VCHEKTISNIHKTQQQQKKPVKFLQRVNYSTLSEVCDALPLRLKQKQKALIVGKAKRDDDENVTPEKEELVDRNNNKQPADET
jgi:hypothetical protein